MNNLYEAVQDETTDNHDYHDTNSNNNIGRTRKRICHQIHNRDKLLGLGLGQILSLCLAASGAMGSSLQYQCNISIPTLQAAFIYLSLAIFMFPCLPSLQQREMTMDDASRENHSRVSTMTTTTTATQLEPQEIPRHFILGKPIYGSLRLYCLMAFLDVEANYFIILAYRYTTLTSISILDALAIPSAMLCSILILRRRYTQIHVIGVLVSILGMTINVMHDYDMDSDDSNHRNDQEYNDDDTPFPFKVRGDALAIIGSVLYGLNDTLTERIVKIRNGSQEYLAMLGIMAFAICCVQSLILEQDSIRKLIQLDNVTCSAAQSTLLFTASSAFGFLSYFGMSQFLIKSEAALLNLSLLTGDLWAALFVIEAQSIALSVPFWVALVLIVMGVVIYEFSSWSSHEALEETNEDIAMTAL
jgi:solute carrier family 35, member F1/2